MEKEMEAKSSSGGGDGYRLEQSEYRNEDILFCLDVDSESVTVDMKVSFPTGRSITRLDSIKQAILLFIHSKLSIHPFHRFAFSTLAHSASWLRKEFSSEVESAMAAFRELSVEQSSGKADLTQLFRIAAHEAKKSRAQNRILRVILIYCRSSVQPHYHWPISQKTFTFDVVYLHDKPGPTNCPQKVYDSLVDALEHVSEYEGYIHESGQGLSRTLFRHMCILLSHPQQRCGQDNIDVPKSLTRKSPSTDLVLVSGEEFVPVSSQ